MNQRIALLFAGQGAQEVKMGKGLRNTLLPQSCSKRRMRFSAFHYLKPLSKVRRKN